MRHCKMNECDLSCSRRAWDNVVAIKSKNAQEVGEASSTEPDANQQSSSLYGVRRIATREVQRLGLGLREGSYARREGWRIGAIGTAEGRCGRGVCLAMGEVRIGSRAWDVQLVSIAPGADR